MQFSNRTQLSFIGKNYAFRPYFQQALEGHLDFYAAVGVTSGKRGLYISCPVFDDRQLEVLGVLVYKVSPTYIEQSVLGLHQNLTSCLVTPQGVIFISNAPGLRLRWLWQPTVEDQNAALASRQFGRKELAWSGLLSSRESLTQNILAPGLSEFLLAVFPGWRLFFVQPQAEVGFWDFVCSSADGRAMSLAVSGVVFISLFLFYLVGHGAQRKDFLLSELRKLNIALDQTSLTVVITDVLGNIVYANQAFTKSTGYTKEEALGLNPRVLKADGVLPDSFYAELWQTISNGLAWKGDFCNRKKDGTVYWESAVIAPIFGAEEKIKNFIAVKQDITEQRENIFALECFKKILDRIMEAVLIVDPQTLSISYANMKAAQLSDRQQPDALLGRFLGDLLPSLKAEDLKQTLQAIAQQEQKTITMESRLRQKNMLCQVEILFQNIYLDRDKQVFVAIIRDISQQRVILEQIIAAKNEAESANRLKSEFLATMSHEIRTPLNAVIGMAELLSSTQVTPEQEEYISSLKHSGENLLALINSILDLAKIERGRMELSLTSLPLRTLVNDLADSLLATARKKSLALFVHVDDAIPDWVVADVEKLRQILTNLLGNAIKFTDAGEIKLALTMVKQSFETAENRQFNEIRFSVKDTGSGIAAENQSQIFDRFRQLDGSSTRAVGGTGLGLALVKSLVELMGSEVGLVSSPGQGSEFFFTLKLATGSPAVKARSEKSGHNFDLNILVVDDNELNRLVAEGLLDKIGCRVSSVSSGAEALSELQAKNYDLVFMDIQMPEMDGFKATEKIRALPGNMARIPIIAMTAHAFREDRQRCLASGMDGYLAKPFSLESVKIELQRLFSGSETEAVQAEVADCQAGPGQDSWSSEKILDSKRLLYQFGNDQAMLANFYAAAIELLPSTVKLLEAALRDNSAQQIRQAAHKLNGAAASVGALRLQAYCLNVEQLVSADEELDAEVEIEKLSQLCAQTIRLLVEEMSS